MDLTDGDRSKLRESQRRIHADGSVIGNIIEHHIQDPKKYKKLSRAEKGLEADKQPKDLEVMYESQFYQSGKLVKELEQLDLDDLPINQCDVEQNGWLNMSVIEKDKLGYMSNQARKAFAERVNKSTRFQRNGEVFRGKQQAEAKVSQALEPSPHSTHSGHDDSDFDEAHDIESLVQMLDSTYDPQVTYALQVIANIAMLSNEGRYDASFDESIHSVLVKNCLLRVRHRLDHPNETVCLNAIICLQRLICNTARSDEIFVDRMFPLIFRESEATYKLQTDEMGRKEFNIEMKDIECLEIDVVRTLVHRTDVLTRFEYLLKNKQGRSYPTYQECILDIIIRIARHSRAMCQTIMKTTLLDIVMSPNFLQTNLSQVTGRALSITCKTLKIVRMIAQASIGMKSNLLFHGSESKRSLVTALHVYLNIDYFCAPQQIFTQLIEVHVECLRILTILCQLDEFKRDVTDVTTMGRPKLVEDLQRIATYKSDEQMERDISPRWLCAAHLLNLLGFFLQDKLKYPYAFASHLWSNFVMPMTLQWFKDIISDKTLPHLDVSITIATALNYCAEEFNMNRKLVDIMLDTSSFDIVRQKLKGVNYFKFLLSEAYSRTQLNDFMTRDGKLRDAKCLPSFGFIRFNNTHLVTNEPSPTVAHDSPYILLDTIVRKLLMLKIESLNELKPLVNSLDLVSYVRIASSYGSYKSEYEPMVQRSVVAQYEVALISRLLLLLGRYYLENVEVDETNEVAKMMSLEVIGQTKSECYSNLCLHTIGAVGLLDPRGIRSLDLKDELLTKILFDYKFQEQIVLEGYVKRLPFEDYFSSPVLDEEGNPLHQTISPRNLRVISPVYLSSEQADRFWLFRPFNDYYVEGQIMDEAYAKAVEDPNVSKGQARMADIKKYREKYFANDLDPRHTTAELAVLNNHQVISILLNFNFVMMRMSVQYIQLFIKPNLEDALCSIGTIFLDDELFLDRDVSWKMTENIKIMLHQCLDRSGKSREIFSSASRTLKSLKMTLGDYFNKLLDQYESASYADIAFSNFMLLFLNPYSDIIFRRKLFQEKSETCIRLLSRLGGDSVWVPRELYMSKKETDPEMRQILLRSSHYITQGSFLSAYVHFNTN